MTEVTVTHPERLGPLAQMQVGLSYEDAQAEWEVLSRILACASELLPEAYDWEAVAHFMRKVVRYRKLLLYLEGSDTAYGWVLMQFHGRQPKKVARVGALFSLEE